MELAVQTFQATNQGRECVFEELSMVRIMLIAFLTLLATAATARDNGQYATSPLKKWFDGLSSQTGLCCSFADGVSIEDVDWDVKDGHYLVRIRKQWVPVPDAAIVTEPNRLGPAVVWPYEDAVGAIQIRCFIPGAGG